jgi:O-antigen/teichoic acid export membrane protein
VTLRTGNGLLDRSMAHALAWNAAARWASQILSWLSTIVVARLLTPSDYGLIGMACLYLNLAQLISQAGIGDTIIALRHLNSRQVSELNSVALMTGTILLGLSCAVAFPLARFFSSPQLCSVILVSSTMYLINAFQIVPKALLQKELRFKLLAGIETARAFAQIVTTLLLAWLKWGYWSLVAGFLVGYLTSSALTYFSKRQGFAIPNLGQLRRELKFSRAVMFSSVAAYLYENADFTVAGRMLGEVPLGNYSVAWTISSAPVEKIANLVTGVMPTFFSTVQADKTELRRYLLRLTEIISLVTLPASIGLVIVADYLVPILLGPKWYGVIGPLRLLGVFFAVRSIATIIPNLLVSIGEATFVMWASLGGAVIMVVAFLIGSRWGTNGIASGWVFGYPLILIPIYHRAFKATGVQPGEYFAAVKPALAGSTLMGCVVLLARLLLPARTHSVVGLLFLMLIGAASYSLALLTLHRPHVQGLISTAANMFKSGQGSRAVEPARDKLWRAEPVDSESSS